MGKRDDPRFFWLLDPKFLTSGNFWPCSTGNFDVGNAFPHKVRIGAGQRYAKAWRIDLTDSVMLAFATSLRREVLTFRHHKEVTDNCHPAALGRNQPLRRCASRKVAHFTAKFRTLAHPLRLNFATMFSGDTYGKIILHTFSVCRIAHKAKPPLLAGASGRGFRERDPCGWPW
jgi:hypothetical protein